MSAPRVSVKQGPLFPKKLKPGRLLSTTATPTVLWRRDARPMRRSSEGMWRIHCLTGGVCSGCWPSPPIWPRYLLKELTCLRGLAGTGVPDGMCMCVVCRLSFSQINVKFVKKRGGGEQLSKNLKNNRGHVPPGSSRWRHNGLSASHEWAQLLQTTWACPVFK